MAKKTYTIYGRRPNSPANIVPLYFRLYTYPPLYTKKSRHRFSTTSGTTYWILMCGDRLLLNYCPWINGT